MVRGSEPTALESGGYWLRVSLYAVRTVVRARNDDDCIGNTLGKLTRIVKNS